MDEPCHELGHDGDAAACLAGLAECLPKCSSSACDFLATYCEGIDDACHEVGHDGDAAACDAQLQSCAMTCAP
jgi:hypothetical protein